MTESHDLSLALAHPEEAEISAKVLVLGVLSTPEGPELLAGPLDAETAEGLDAVLEDLGATGAPDELLRLPGLDGTGADVVALAGLGELPEEGPERLAALRRAAGSAVRQLAGTESAALALPAATLAEVAAVAEGAAYGAFVDSRHRTSAKDRDRRAVEEVVILSEVEASEATPALSRALVLGEAVDGTRRLVNEAPNYLYPETFAAAAVERAGQLPDVSVRVLDEEELAEGGFGGILGVGQGSSRPPRLVVVDYAPKNARKHVALVGKGITFDSGGLSLKPAASMTTMKSDMAGAASVLNAVAAAAELELPVRATAYLCLAENLPSATATRPEDVLTMRGGTTVEVLNTDAEGRLVMADGLAYASESDPDALLDIATLTGAQLIALGTRVSAVMGEEGLRDQVVAAAREAGEDFWAMPLPEYLRAELKTPVADLKNIGAGRNAGMLLAGTFLQEFVGETDGERIPWAHLDIAGPSYNEGKAWGYVPEEGTGTGVATLVALLERFAA